MTLTAGRRDTLVWAAFALAVIAVYAASVSPLGLGLAVAWFAVWGTLRATGVLRRLDAREAFLVARVAVAFPLVELGIKLMIERNVIPYSWFWLNRLEHWAGMTAALLLLYAPLKPAWTALGDRARLLLALGAASLLGNLNEFWEYGLRASGGDLKLGQYGDTILDMAVNLLGGLTAWVVLRAIARRP